MGWPSFQEFCKCFRMWWPGTEPNRRPPAFSGLLTDNAKRFGIKGSSWPSETYKIRPLVSFGINWAIFRPDDVPLLFPRRLLWFQADRDPATQWVPMPQIVSRAEIAVVKKTMFGFGHSGNPFP